MAAGYTLCKCAGRSDPHWKFDQLEDWTIFLITREVVDGDLFAGLAFQPSEEDLGDKEQWEAVLLFLRVLNSIWHVGGVMDDPTFVRNVISEFDLRKWSDFERTWSAVRGLLEPHPLNKGALWHPALEDARVAEFDAPDI